MTGDVPLWLAFTAGLVASVNPCGFALLPSLLVYYLGTDSRGETGGARVADGLVVGLVLTAGFMVVFAIVGVIFAIGARVIVRVVPWLTLIMGLGLVGLGVWLATGRHVTIPLPGIRGRPGTSYRSLFLFGAAYAVGSLSCTLPVFLLVVGSGLAAGSAVGTLAVFLTYALGMSTVLMILCLGTAGLRELIFRKVRRLFPHLNRISGVLLVVGGGYVVYYWSSILRGADQSAPVRLVQDLQRRAQDVLLSIGERRWLLLGILLLAAALLVLGRRVLRGGPSRARGAGSTMSTEDDEAFEEEPV